MAKKWLEEVDPTDIVNLKRAMRRADVSIEDITKAWGYTRRETVSRKIHRGSFNITQAKILANMLGYKNIVMK